MIKSENKKHIILAIDAAIIPGMIFCEWLSGRMLSQYSVCPMLRLGGQCVTCGGTHFVNVILQGHIAEAFQYNPFLFMVTALLGIVLILANLDWLFEVKWAKKPLSWLVSIPSLVAVLSSMLVFFFVRNIPVILRVLEALV